MAGGWKSLTQRLERVFLGSSTTFRNHHRNWLYLGFIAVVAGLIAVARCRGHAP